MPASQERPRRAQDSVEPDPDIQALVVGIQTQMNLPARPIRTASVESSASSGDENEPEEAEEEECIQSLALSGGHTPSRRSPPTEEEGLYTSKGPMRRAALEQRPHHLAPYNKLASGPALPGLKVTPSDELDLVSMGPFLDEIYPELNLNPASPAESDSPTTNGPFVIPVMDVLDGVFGTGKSRILLRNPNDKSGFSAVPAPLAFQVDENHRRIGINIPRQAVPFDCVAQNLAGQQKMDVYLQMDPRIPKVIKVRAHMEESLDDLGSPTWVIRSQYLRLQPFMGPSGLAVLLQDVESVHIEKAHTILATKSEAELLKTFGPNKSTMLMILCLQKDSPKTRSEILAVTKKLLASPDPKVRANILATDDSGSNAFECALLKNKPEVAQFLAEVFYDLGVELTYLTDIGRNTVLHLLARRGDPSALALQTLLNLKFHGNRRVFLSNVPNFKGELPIHIVSRNEKCHLRTIQLLAQDLDNCFTIRTPDGSLPIHYACQFSKDPSLLTALLHFNQNVVNERRGDGFTPLHLVASRSNQQNASHGLIALDEDTQIRMVRLLLEHEADSTLKVDEYLPYDLVDDRTRVKLLLRVRRTDGSQRGSPISGSPPDGFLAGRNGPMMSPLASTMSPSATSGIGSDMSSPYSQHHSPPILDGYVSGNDGGSNQGFYSPMSNGIQGPGSLSSGGGPESSGSDSEDGNNNLDAIAEAIYQQFPSIQEIMNADPDLNPDSNQ